MIIMKTRMDLINDVIKNENLDAIIFFRPDELVMSMGYRPYWGLSVGVFFSNGDSVLYIPALEPSERINSNINVKKYPWGEKCDDPFQVLYEMIKEDIGLKTANNKGISLIKSIGRSSLPILSGENPPLPHDFVEKLSNVGSSYKEIDNELLKLYEYKTQEDIQGLRLCNKVAGVGIRAFYDALKVGNTEADVSAEMEYAIRKEIGNEGVLFAQGYAQVQSGINASFGGTFNWVTHKKLEKGDLVMTEFAVVVNGYWADITRTGIVGQPSEKQIKLHQAIKNAQDKALSILKPGVKASDLHKIAQETLKQEGVDQYFTHALGHGVGFRYHDPCINISLDSEDVLKENMVITIEPGIYDKSFGGIRIEENVLVTKDGYEILSNFTRELKGD